MRPLILASFRIADDADKALGALFDYGISADDVSVVTYEGYRLDEKIVDHAQGGLTTTTPGDAASGAAKGAAIGLSIGAVAAIASLAIPGFGLVLGGGALATALAGTAGTTAAGAVAGGVTGYLKDQGVPEEISERYTNAVREGGVVVGVSIPSNAVQENTVREVLAKYGGKDIHSIEPLPSTEEVPAEEPIHERVPIVVDRSSGERIE